MWKGIGVQRWLYPVPFKSHPRSFTVPYRACPLGMVALYFCSVLSVLTLNLPSLQPEELTNILEISNVVFTSMFALEMILKLAAFGLFDYLRNPYNIFDSIIVIIR